MATAAVLPALLLAAACGAQPSGERPRAQQQQQQQQGAAAAVPDAPTDTLPQHASKLHVDRTEVFYDVTGRTARALLHDLAERGPAIGTERHFGRTAWTARWNLTYERPAGGATRAAPCRMRRVEVHLDVEVTLPRWETPSEAPAALRRDWRSFTDALAFHEREHQESIVSAGRRLVRVLEDLEAPSCSALKQKAGDEARALIDEARDYNRRYDERTGHGHTQGARWPLR